MTAARPKPPGLLWAAALIFAMHVRTIFGSRRVLAAIVLASIAPLLGALGSQLMADHMDGAAVFAVIGLFLQIGFVVPMLSVALGVGAVADEAEGRTITYPFTRPIPRASLFLGRWLASLVLVLVFVTLSTVALGLIAGSRSPGPSRALQEAVLQSSLIGGVLYSVGAAVVGVQFKRGLVVALAYTFAFELLVANVPGSSQKLTIQYHLRAIVMDLVLPVLDIEEMTRPKDMIAPAAARTKLLVIALGLFVVGCWRTSRKQFVLSS